MTAVTHAADLPVARPPKLWGPADLLTLVRLPLAAAFVLMDDAHVRLAILAVAGVSDVLDGIVARRVGPSRAGAVLDPVVDKIFTLSAVFAVVAMPGALILGGWEIAGLLLRDLGVVGGFVATHFVFRRRVTLPARLSGKCVTVLQFATLAAILLAWPAARPIAWATAAVSVWSILDYTRQILNRVRFGV